MLTSMMPISKNLRIDYLLISRYLSAPEMAAPVWLIKLHCDGSRPLALIVGPRPQGLHGQE
jgi:hypothetical protein